MRNNEGLSILSIGKLTGFSEWKKSRRNSLCHQMQTSIYAGSRLPGNHISDQECQHWSARSKDEAHLIPQTTTSLPSYSTTTILFISGTWQMLPSHFGSIFNTADMWTSIQQISFSTTAINSQNRHRSYKFGSLANIIKMLQALIYASARCQYESRIITWCRCWMFF